VDPCPTLTVTDNVSAHLAASHRYSAACTHILSFPFPFDAPSPAALIQWPYIIYLIRLPQSVLPGSRQTFLKPSETYSTQSVHHFCLSHCCTTRIVLCLPIAIPRFFSSVPVLLHTSIFVLYRPRSRTSALHASPPENATSTAPFAPQRSAAVDRLPHASGALVLPRFSSQLYRRVWERASDGLGIFPAVLVCYIHMYPFFFRFLLTNGLGPA
jgi:hypothetical protein